MPQQDLSTHQSALGVLPPKRIASADHMAWNASTDLLVVGWGAAGASAALQGRESGLDVMVLERFEGGGASRLSGGIVYAGGGTRYQQQAGYEDSVEAMFAYLKHENQGVVSDATLREFCAQSKDNLQWLEQHGAQYEASYLKEKTSYPPQDKYFYYSGNEVVPAYRDARYPPAPRGHRTKGKGLSGEALMDALQAATRKSGAQVRTQTSVKRLVVDDAGRVVGVECYSLPPEHALTKRHAKLSQAIPRWRNVLPPRAQKLRNAQKQIEEELIASGAAKPQLIRARKGVVLATGGFIFNMEMLQQYAPHYTQCFFIGAAGCDGSGMRLGLGLGASTAHMQNISAWRFITPPAVLPRSMMVNTQGARFCNEQVYGERIGYEMMEKQNGKAWLILDKRLYRQAIKECLTGGWWYFQWLPALLTLLQCKKAATPQALAQKMGADAQTLRAELEAYNRAAAHPGADPLQPTDPQGKAADFMQALDQAPYYAMDISLTSPFFPLPTITLGGLQVDESSGLVRNARGGTIAGLYAVGRTAVGLPSARYVSGLSLADCVFSGRRAARHAAAQGA